ncbi:MAG TPA: PqqD family protein [Candidatus Polarisedimenticolia bacterium]|nr:PqqD family protein [Candidatus Polarisedimenticolia bacterium]
MDLKTVLVRNPEAAYRIYDGEATIVLPGRAEVKVLNLVGSLVWDRIDGRQELGAILQQILAEFDTTPATAEADLLEFATALREHGMVS